MTLARIKHFFERFTARGTTVLCPCCDRQARRFFPAGVTNKRPRARCVFCGSLERHRLVALMLKTRPPAHGARTLCIAPEAPLTLFFKRAFDAHITTSDLLRTDVDVQTDVCALPFEGAAFDMVVANHVLEHVADDQAAMRELRRVTKPGGQAILQTPLRWSVATTEEDLNADAAERLRRFGQDDHVRLYGRDIVQKLQNAGWGVETVAVLSYFSPADIEKYGLEAGEIFFSILNP